MMQLQRYIRKPTKLTDSLITGLPDLIIPVLRNYYATRHGRVLSDPKFDYFFVF